MNKYVAYSVRRDVYSNYVVCGQDSESLNWHILERGFDFIPDANHVANVLACTASLDWKCYIPCYGLGGYCIGEYYKGEKYKR